MLVEHRASPPGSRGAIALCLNKSCQGDFEMTMKLVKMLSKPAAWASGWTSAVLCFSAATGYWLAEQRGRAICWVALGAIEVAAIVL